MTESVSSISLEPGFYALRYVKCERPGVAAQVFVACATGSERAIQLLPAPHKSLADALVPGNCVVVRAERSGKLQLTIRSLDRNEPPEVELKLVSLDGELSTVGATEIAPQSAAVGPAIELTGHVSRRGDVRASSAQWIAGPDAPAPIEGLQVEIHGVDGVSVEYQVLMGGQNGAWTDWMTAGAYAGTRGHFRPLLAGRFRLTGPRAPMFQIEAEALFLGSPVQAVVGGNVEVTSGALVDPMVGLKIALTKAERTQKAAVPEMGAKTEQASRSRVRVFRASGAR